MFFLHPRFPTFSRTHNVFRIGQAMKKKYRREMDYVYAVISEMERKLERTIRDLDDVRLIMDTLKKIREQEVDMELKIDPIEVLFQLRIPQIYCFIFRKHLMCLTVTTYR